MSTRDDARLTARERAALANLEAAAAADDPQLASRLKGTTGTRLRTLLPRAAAYLSGKRLNLLAAGWWGIPIAAAGLAIVVWSLSTSFVLGVAGALVVAVGLRLIAAAVESRWSAGGLNRVADD